MDKLADLNFFLKSIEKDLGDQYKNKSSQQSTPNTLLRKVEDQMRALGLDKKNTSSSNLNALLSSLD